MYYIAQEAASERSRERRRRAEAARLARQARRSRRPAPGRTSGWLRLGRRITAALAAAARAQRRVAVLHASLDRHLPQPHQPPSTYPEFLARTAGPLLHEPSAAARSRGCPVG
jgi:hypothetical protein